MLILCSYVYAEDYEVALIPIDSGAILAFSGDSTSFTIELPGDSILPLEGKYFILVDDWVFQAFILPFDNPTNANLKLESEAKKALSQYVTYEIDYMKKELNQPLDSLSLNWGKIGNNYFYWWYFNVPASNESIKKQLYLSTICFNHFLNMNLPLQSHQNFDDAKKFIFNVARSLKQQNHPIDFDTFSENIKENGY